MPLLKVTDLQVHYGAIQAVKGISFEIEQGEIVALIGANGAGKTTILHALSGLRHATSGSILFSGAELVRMPAHKIVRMGVSHVPEGRKIFQELTVYENLKLGAYTRNDKTEILQSIETVYMRFPRLKERRKQAAGTLSGGEQQMLAIGRALMSRPKLVLMDEPSMGLSPLLITEVFKMIRSINQSGTTVLLVEQNAKKALSIADRAYVLEMGRIALKGKASDLLHDSEVKRAYLGEA